MPELIPVLTEEEIHKKVEFLAQQISHDYDGRQLVLIGVLKGAFIFLADLARKLTVPVEIDFIWASSYRAGDTSCGEVTLSCGMNTDIRGKDVLLVEDILDTGKTIVNILPALEKMGPASVKVCAFIDKKERREVECRTDYIGHSVVSGFLVGFGLDCSGKYRNLPAIYDLKF